VHYYDAAHLSLFSVIGRWHGTISPLVASTPEFWLLLAFHSACHYWAPPPPEDNKAMDHLWTAALMPSSLVTFLLVFYGGNCYQRYFQLHSLCVGMGGAAMEWIAQVIQWHDHSDPLAQWNKTRHVLAAMHIQYSLLRSTDFPPIVEEADWVEMVDRHLLDRHEVATLKAYKGYKPFLPITWSLSAVRKAIAHGSGAGKSGRLGELSPAALMAFHSFEQTAFKMRGSMGALANMKAQPIPFAYFHALKVAVLSMLGMVGYWMVDLLYGQPLYISLLTFAVFEAMTLGLLEVAVAMSDPFGEDEVDIDTQSLSLAAYTNAVALLGDKTNPSQHLSMPAELDNKHVKLDA